MHICFRCSKPIEASICLFQKNYYHADCCRICTPNPVKPPAPVKEKTPSPPPPPPPPKVEIADPKKVRAAPGRLSFNLVGSFEATKDVNCRDCKKKIVGQRFLTYKLGVFCCKDCNSVNEDKCFMCKNVFKSEECFKDDEGNKCCNPCIKNYMSEKKKKAREQQAAASAPKPEPPLPTPVPIKQTNVIHCDSCTGALLQETVEFEDGNYHPDCLACYSCKTKLRGQTIYQEEKGLACEKCKHTVKCNECKRGFAGGESYYAGTDLLEYCMSCYYKKHSKACNKCPNLITPGNSYILFEDKNYHFDCFLCGDCNNKIGSDTKEFYMDVNLKKYCEPCVKKYINANKGSKTTTWTAIVFFESQEMPSCFECKKKFSNNESFYKGKNNQPYCVECYSKLNSKKCHGCEKMIIPSEVTLTIGDRNYHTNCLKCFKCSKVLGATDEIYSKEDKFSCGKCISE